MVVSLACAALAGLWGGFRFGSTGGNWLQCNVTSFLNALELNQVSQQQQKPGAMCAVGVRTCESAI